MLKQSFLLAAMLLMLTDANAQFGSLGLSIGPSFPVGSFGDDEVNNSSSGLAKTGLLLEIGYTHPVSKYFSLAMMLHGQLNGLNTEALENTFSKTRINNTPFLFDGTTPPPPPTGTIYPNWKFSKSYWRTGSLLLGGQVQLPLGSRGLYFIGKAMAGPTYVSSPKIEGSSITDTATAHVSQTSEHAVGLGYLIGGGVQYGVSKKLFITGRLDFFGTNKITFEDVTASVTTTKGNPSNPLGYTITQMQMTADAKQTISTVNLSVGIGLRL
jgi:hypothetical protein